jgi:cytochrome P450
MKDPFACYRQWQQKFGDTFMVRALNGDVVATCDRENVRKVFAARSDETGQFAVETIKPLMGGSSVLLIEGEQHRRERGLLSPAFRGQRINKNAELIREVAMRVASDWETGETIRMMDPALEVSLEVIIRVVFGVQAEDKVESLKRQIKSFVGTFHPMLAFSKLLQRPLLGLSPWNRFVKARNELHESLDAEIGRHSGCPVMQDNMLSGLLHSKYEDGENATSTGIRDQLVAMLMAGHETTQIAISWAMNWLHRHPEYADRLRAELDEDDSVEAITNSSLLNGICNESLRINSVISDVVRTLREPMEWQEGTLPAGTNIAVAICLIHEDPELYPEPFRFNPDRWNDRDFKPTEFIPFGGGTRKCLGATLAMLEMKMVVAAWMKNFQFESPSDAPEKEPLYRRNITMAPKSGIPLKFIGARRAQA